MANFVNCIYTYGAITIPSNYLEVIPFVILVCILIITIIVAYVQWAGREKVKELMNKKTNKDVLTGYSNFTQFLDDAHSMLKYKEARYAIGYIDVSNFKSINDNYGRTQGDNVLKVVSDKINDLVVPNGIFRRGHSLYWSAVQGATMSCPLSLLK